MDLLFYKLFTEPPKKENAPKFYEILTWVSEILTWVSDRHREVLITSLPPSMKFENGASFLD